MNRTGVKVVGHPFYSLLDGSAASRPGLTCKVPTFYIVSESLSLPLEASKLFRRLEGFTTSVEVENSLASANYDGLTTKWGVAARRHGTFERRGAQRCGAVMRRGEAGVRRVLLRRAVAPCPRHRGGGRGGGVGQRSGGAAWKHGRIDRGGVRKRARGVRGGAQRARG